MIPNLPAKGLSPLGLVWVQLWVLWAINRARPTLYPLKSVRAAGPIVERCRAIRQNDRFQIESSSLEHRATGVLRFIYPGLGGKIFGMISTNGDPGDGVPDLANPVSCGAKMHAAA